MARLDVYLVERGYFSSRARAQAAVEGGFVTVGGEVARKAAMQVRSGGEADGAPACADGVEVLPGAYEGASLYVGRGGAKLAAALDRFGIDVSGADALDIGASTGGFTDCLLRRGAARVFCVDVGEGQLHAALRADPRVTLFERTNARSLAPGQINGGACAFAVVDVSFISLTHVLAPTFAQLSAAGSALCLVKPQFEVGPRHVGKKGVVRDERQRARAVDLVASAAQALGLRELGRMRSPILGGGGNAEFFLWLSAYML